MTNKYRGFVPFFVAMLPHCYNVEAIPYAEETFGVWELQRYDYIVVPAIETPLY